MLPDDGHFAGPDELRLAALLECANDPALRRASGSRAAAMARTGSPRRRSRQFGPRREDKLFLGYSDAGYLLGALYRARIGQPGPRADARRHPPRWRRGGGAPGAAYFAGDRTGLEPSLDQHPTVAFNLMTLAMLCGTPLMPGLAGHVVMVEEVSEHLYAVDRLFFHVTAHLGGIAGLRLGRVSDVPENDRPFGATRRKLPATGASGTPFPSSGAADIGHDAANRIVPFGLARRDQQP